MASILSRAKQGQTVHKNREKIKRYTETNKSADNVFY